jgi:hypothetical protein
MSPLFYAAAGVWELKKTQIHGMKNY